MANDIELLKFNLQEREYPYFPDSELEILLQQHKDVKTATYYGCIMKANNDGIEVSGIKIPSNSAYWLKLAEEFKPKQVLSYKTSMKRADER